MLSKHHASVRLEKKAKIRKFQSNNKRRDKIVVKIRLLSHLLCELEE